MKSAVKFCVKSTWSTKHVPRLAEAAAMIKQAIHSKEIMVYQLTVHGLPQIRAELTDTAIGLTSHSVKVAYLAHSEMDAPSHVTSASTLLRRKSL